ncbi:hypothetical protein AMR42_10075 [Limnothrix sp. PR1529]|nr:hypothetical protein BCR12_09895 [Limnothrix sp. P13C2]PIB10899.1 hypothetical protein AMR42_10075 [Limnothrix sp. PR1529]
MAWIWGQIAPSRSLPIVDDLSPQLSGSLAAVGDRPVASRPALSLDPPGISIYLYKDPRWIRIPNNPGTLSGIPPIEP